MESAAEDKLSLRKTRKSVLAGSMTPDCTLCVGRGEGNWWVSRLRNRRATPAASPKDGDGEDLLGKCSRRPESSPYK